MTDEELKQLVATNSTAIGELRESMRESNADLRASIGELRESINSLRDIVAGHEWQLIRPESKEIDLWCNYLTLHDRVQRLERWKHKLQSESDRVR